MSATVSPALVSPALSSTASPARARSADEPQGRSFHAALDRSRASQADAEAGADSASLRPGTPRRGAAGAKDEAAPEIPNLDFFVPAVPVPVTAAAARTAADAVTAAALRGAATATERTDAQAASKTTDAAAEAVKAAADIDPAAIDAAAEGARADGKPADATAADLLRAAAGKASTTAAQADAAAATAKADAALPATPAATPLLNAAMASTVPTPSTPTARTGRADTATPMVTGTAATAEAAEADPLDLLAARIETTAGSDAGVADDSTPNAPLAWMAAQPGNAGIASGTAATDNRAPVLTLAPPLDSDAWAPALGQQMLRMSASGMHTAQLSINPENLGPLQITLKLGEDQAQAMFVSAHESVRKAVEAALPQLRTTLAEHGISLGQTAVGADTRQSNGQASFAGDNPSGRSGGNGGSAYPGAARSNTVASNAVPATAVRNTRAEGAVDTFA